MTAAKQLATSTHAAPSIETLRARAGPRTVDALAQQLSPLIRAALALEEAIIRAALADPLDTLKIGPHLRSAQRASVSLANAAFARLANNALPNSVVEALIAAEANPRHVEALSTPEDDDDAHAQERAADAAAAAARDAAHAHAQHALDSPHARALAAHARSQADPALTARLSDPSANVASTAHALAPTPQTPALRQLSHSTEFNVPHCTDPPPPG